jgi:hypothetical protein
MTSAARDRGRRNSRTDASEINAWKAALDTATRET